MNPGSKRLCVIFSFYIFIALCPKNRIALKLFATMTIRSNTSRPKYISASDDYESFEKSFPFVPTVDQQHCFNDVANDMVNKTTPMDRLICGDVGFGKTEVALRAIYRAVLSKRQVRRITFDALGG